MDISMEEPSPNTEKEKWVEEMGNMHIESAIMNRLVMDYLVTEGFKEAAEKFEEETGIPSGADLTALDARIRVRDAILAGSIELAVSMINEMHPELLDNNRILLFYLQLQHLIELIRAEKMEDALEFAQTQLSERGEDSPECLSDMERALALLVFDKPEESPFADLLLQSQRHKVWSRVNAAIMDYENTVSAPRLASIVKLLMWSQDQLDKKKIKYPKMTDISKGEI
uniref:glucose-induced degradation protein 8 homolog n=1 Tax=Ciona intestinalis TaxID=7719 RepID=UPI00005235F3|nr:glucose-induced degradation protein 8 homolog [Ciona intestinalis]|eukprot:XP_002127838.1 glucose-induced degradation protein 8 homolog [Ciona intestinalis]